MQRFTQWVNNLEAVCKEVEDENLAHLLNETIEKIDDAASQVENQIKFPKRLRKQLKLTDVHDLRFILRHIALPAALKAAEQEASSASNIVSSREISADFSSMKLDSTVPLLWKFFDLKESRSNSELAICGLADVFHRLLRAKRNDFHVVETVKNEEEAKIQQFTKEIQRFEHRLQYLREGSLDEELIQNGLASSSSGSSSSVIKLCFHAMQQELSQLREEECRAWQAEELARQVYENAIKARKEAAARVQSAELSFSAAASQSQILRQTSEKAMELQSGYLSAAVRRKEIFGCLESMMNLLDVKRASNLLKEDLPRVLTSALRSFEECCSVSNIIQQIDGPASPEWTRFYYSRIGLELARLWRQLIVPVAASLNQDVFVREITSILSTFESNHCAVGDGEGFRILNASSCEQMADHDGSTIVLYYDHLIHETPEDHVEKPMRVKSSIEALKILQQDSFSQEMHWRKSSENNKKYSKRKLLMFHCNDVSSPPAWCLPLVHSTDYLSKLWTLSDNATTNNAYVPLEFDTEWESSLPADSSDDDRPVSSRVLRRHLTVSDDVVAHVGVEGVAEFVNLLCPTEMDHALAKQNDQFDLEDLVDRHDGRATNRKQIQDKIIPTGDVLTSYGRGKVVKTCSRSGCTEVLLCWGGKGYFNSASVQPIIEVPPIQGLDAETVVRILNEAKSELIDGVVRFPPTPGEALFLNKDLFLHAVTTKMIDIVESKRCIAEAAGIKPAIFSLWIHGRSSRGPTDIVESRLHLWLAYFCKDYSPPCFRMDNTQPKRRGRSCGGVYKKPANVKMRTDQNDNDNDSDSDGDMNNSQPTRDQKLTARGSVRKRRSAVPLSTQQLMMQSEEEDRLRDLLKHLMKQSSCNQTVLAKQFLELSGVEVTQGGMSAWFLYKTKEPLFSNLRRAALLWVRSKGYLLGDADRSELTALEEYFSTHRSIVRAPPEASQKRYRKKSVDKHSDDDEVTDDNQGSDGDEEDEEICSVDEESTDDVGGSLDDESESLALPPTSVFPTERKVVGTEYFVESKDDSMEVVDSEELNTQSLTRLEQENSVIPTDFTDPRSLAELHSLVCKEIRRRGISQLTTTNEARLDTIGFGQPSLSKFLHTATVNPERAEQFLVLMSHWLRYSVTRGSSDHENVEEALEEQFCDQCGRSSRTFAAMRGFHLHVAWCMRKKVKKVVAPTKAQQEKLESVKTEENAADENLDIASMMDPPARKRQKTEDELEDKEAVGEPSSDISNADVMPERYRNCEICSRPANYAPIVTCSTCPSIFHSTCFPTEMMVPAPFHCEKCKECGVLETRALLPQEIEDETFIRGKWILLYGNMVRRWRKALVLASKPGMQCIFVKWWRLDNRGGKTHWLNVEKSKVLLVQQDDSIAVVNEEMKNAQMKMSAPAKKRNRPPVSRMDSCDGVKAVARSCDPSSHGIGGRVALFPEEDTDFQQHALAHKAEGSASSSHHHSSNDGMSDTYISSHSLKAALCAAGAACRAVDLAMRNSNSNVFVCTRPPGHHAGRFGCTSGCLSTGFCLLNNAALAMVYARVRWGVDRIAIVDIDVHFGNGTAELLRDDPRAFFASVHMIYGDENSGTVKKEAAQAMASSQQVVPPKDRLTKECDDLATQNRESMQDRSLLHGFYPEHLGCTEINDNFVLVGVGPAKSKTSNRRKRDGSEYAELPASPAAATVLGEGSQEGRAFNIKTEPEELPDGDKLQGTSGYRKAIKDIIIPKMIKFQPQLLIISAGFDGFSSDPIGGELQLTLDDYFWSTRQLTLAMEEVQGADAAKVISLLEGGYDVNPETMGLSKCVVSHVKALQEMTV